MSASDHLVFFAGTKTAIVIKELQKLLSVIVERTAKSPFDAYALIVDQYSADVNKGFWPITKGKEPVPIDEVSNRACSKYNSDVECNSRRLV